jgi:hypothetical protein
VLESEKYSGNSLLVVPILLGSFLPSILTLFYFIYTIVAVTQTETSRR